MTHPPGDASKIFAEVDQSAYVSALIGYLELAAEHPHVRRWHEMAIEQMRPAYGLRVLDAGCGLGGAAREIAGHAGAGNVTAVDVSVQMIEAARARDDGATGVEYAVADVTALPYPDDSYELTRCERVLQHLDDPDIAIAELTRVTAPGGTVCVLDTDWASLVLDVGDAGLEQWLLADLVSTSPQPRIGRSLRRRFVRAGLRDVEVGVLPWTWTSLDDVAVLLPFFDESIPAESGVVALDRRDAWFAALRRADAEGTLWVSAHVYVATGTVPATAA